MGSFPKVYTLDHTLCAERPANCYLPFARHQALTRVTHVTFCTVGKYLCSSRLLVQSSPPRVCSLRRFPKSFWTIGSHLTLGGTGPPRGRCTISASLSHMRRCWRWEA